MKTVRYVSPYVSAEWIAAHGLRPERLTPRAAEMRHTHTGECCYAEAFVDLANADTSVAAVVFATTCDQMRRASEFAGTASPAFVLNVPATWQTAGARKYYRTELERLGDFLVSVGGTPPKRNGLIKIIAEYNTARQKLRAAHGRLSGKAYTETILAFHRHGPGSVDLGGGSRIDGIPLALVGGPLFESHLGVFDAIEQAGGTVVLDATTTGERTLPGTIQREHLEEDPLDALVRAYFDTIPDAFRRPNTRLFDWLECECQSRQVRGILFHAYPWCDLWRIEAQRIRSRLGLPFLELSLGHDGTPDVRTTSRIQAFLETLA